MNMDVQLNLLEERIVRALRTFERDGDRLVLGIRVTRNGSGRASGIDIELLNSVE